MTLRILPIVVAALLLFHVAASAQTSFDPTRGEPTGIRESARTLDTQLTRLTTARARARVARPDERDPDVFAFIPAVTWASGANIGGATAAYVSNAFKGHPIQVRGGYRRLDFGGAENRDLVSLDSKMAFVNMAGVRVAGYGEMRRVLDTSRQVKIGAAAEVTVRDRATLAANLDYVNAKPDEEEGTKALIPGLGFAFAWSNVTETSIDYTFNNDVDGDYDISFTLSQQLWGPAHRPLSLSFGIARHRTIFITAVQKLSLQ